MTSAQILFAIKMFWYNILSYKFDVLCDDDDDEAKLTL